MPRSRRLVPVPRRSDGTYVRDLPPLRRVIPHLMRTRAESIVYFQQRIEVDGLLAWLEETNTGRPRSEQVTLFHVFLTAIARTMRLRPQTNRFVAGRRTFEHRDISISFVVKQGLTDEAEESEARVVLTGTESVDDVRGRVADLVRRERAAVERGADDRLVDLFASAPRPVLSGVAAGLRWLDYHDLVPRALVEAIPLYTSVYVVHAGSIGIDPPFHHLYETGTASAFVSIGRVAPQPVVDSSGAVVARQCLDVVYTLDERAADGFYFARTAEVIRRLVAEPELLGDPSLTVEQLVPVWPPR
ncbi:hypothetical protein GCM10011376_33860 [Nocardioides flavus (ex Wang et al. 2016)]|uniref:2-oxoacid dehydrogenase acyltransferase catalytic domain-containing protein n=1 Tax=Nocardioides flavus (ex Wang et al. 2016) TaxID=2058780 RepID=A0ABQ3HMK9_9ACTN|nr:2-oxo acid dehydrogenase subunit E2 [Nocardioides flavus (ex Wang et al. 2016)]GHE18776.1 hypothetical protein GCM10011376_33860 [Nocardioides flavus (ex Wang et al. 2016)]